MEANGINLNVHIYRHIYLKSHDRPHGSGTLFAVEKISSGGGGFNG
jgi:hypothetical protein